jgi:glucose-1-phosphate cytidylyltransferase
LSEWKGLRELDAAASAAAGQLQVHLEGGDACIFERTPLERLAREGQLKAWRHEGFWQCMDTFREQELLNKVWATGRAPWKIW